jgi:BASS family bile acid:Na+ symporter
MSSGSAVAVETPKKSSGLWDLYIKTTDTLTTLFPVWTVLFAGLALAKPSSFSWFTTNYFTASLGALMLSMGITLTPEDFTRVATQPAAVIIGFILCYGLMPVLGLALGKGEILRANLFRFASAASS